MNKKYRLKESKNIFVRQKNYEALAHVMILTCCRTSSDMPDILSRRKLKQSPSEDLPWCQVISLSNNWLELLEKHVESGVNSFIILVVEIFKIKKKNVAC